MNEVVIKYAAKLEAANPIAFAPLTPERAVEVGEAYGLTPERVGSVLYEMWAWYSTRKNREQRRVSNAIAMFGAWCRNERDRRTRGQSEAQTATVGETRCECESWTHFPWCPKARGADE